MECLILIKQKTLASMCSTKHSWSVKEIQNIKLSQKFVNAVIASDHVKHY